MFKKLSTRLILLSLVLSISTPVSATYGRRANDEACCLLGLTAGICCCLLARAPAGGSLHQRSNVGLGLVTAYMVADTGLNIATSVMDYYAKKDTADNTDSAKNNFETATALSGLSAGLLFLATVGSVPSMLGPTLGTVFSFMALGISAFGLGSYIKGYDKLDDTTSSNQKSALVLYFY